MVCSLSSLVGLLECLRADSTFQTVGLNEGSMLCSTSRVIGSVNECFDDMVSVKEVFSGTMGSFPVAPIEYKDAVGSVTRVSNGGRQMPTFNFRQC